MYYQNYQGSHQKKISFPNLKSAESFLKLLHTNNIDLGNQLLLFTLFDYWHFEAPYYLKLCPISVNPNNNFGK